MTDRLRLISLAALLAPLGACADSQPVSGNEAWEPITAAAGNAAGDAVQLGDIAEAPESNAVANDSAPLGAEAEEMAATRVLVRWAAAVERRDWAAARREWAQATNENSPSEQEMARDFEDYAQIDVALGQGRVEGAAGSLYYQAPVTITGTTRGGDPYRLQGQVTLRRVNDVPGASPDALSWHLSQSELKPAS